MTREQFLELVKNPAQPISADSIASLAGQFPYCQPLRYLYLKKLAETESVQYPQQLKITAALSPDRTRLFRFIHPEPATVQAEDLMAGLYSSDGAEATSAASVENTIASPEPTEIPAFEPLEYEAPQEETRMSVEEIVNQRLKELNLWQEPEADSSSQVDPLTEVAETTMTPADNPPDSFSDLPVVETPEETILPLSAMTEEIIDQGMVAEPSLRVEETTEEMILPPSALAEEVIDQGITAEEITAEPHSFLSPEAEEKTFAEGTAPFATETAAQQTAGNDPLEDIIRESLIETRLRNADYFDSLAVTDAAATSENDLQLSAQQISQPEPVLPHSEDTVSSEARTETESYAIHTGEIHSFAEWLKLNQSTSAHPVADANEPPSSDVGAVNIPEAMAHAEVQPLAEVKPLSEVKSHAEATDTAEDVQQQVPKSTTDERQPASLTAGLSEKMAAPKEHRSYSAPAIRFLYVKSGADIVDAASTPIGSSHSPVSVSTPAQEVIPASEANTAKQPERIPGSEPSVPEAVESAPEVNQVMADPTQETIFTGEIIPPRKPIPDPSLVDTDPPKPRVPPKELIDKFIREEPRITPSKSTFYSPSNMAKKSVIEPDDIVTETLASIYAQQGNYQKAITFYQKLSLKFPEKSRYFAALIDELKKKSNS